MTGFMTVKEAAKKWNVSERQVQILCKNGRIKGVERIGRSWIIPENIEKPADERIKTSRYKNWRNPHTDDER